jgi:hypothetical protein
MNKNKTLKQVNEIDYLTVDEAASELGIKTNAIRNYLYLGKFTTHKFKNLTLLDVNEVNNWKDRQK